MPFLIKTLFAFEGLGQGWAEQFYWQSATDDLDAAEGIITPIAQARAKCLSASYVLSVVRNGIVQNDTGGKVKRVTDIIELRINGVQAWADAEPNIALMNEWQTWNNKATKKLYMRGIPAGVAANGKLPVMSYGVFQTNWNSLVSKLIALPAGWLVTQVPPSGGGNFYQAIISTYAQGDDGLVTFTLSTPGLTWPVPNGFQTTVHVAIAGRNPLDGPLLVVPTSSTSCYTAKPWGVRPFPVGTLGVMSLRQPTLVTLGPPAPQQRTGIIHPQRIVTHKTGRPTFASRGRRSAALHW